MSSQLKSETARANGAKSRGPVTPQGRATSSRNSLRHGFTAKSIVLPAESQQEFQSLLDSYIHQFDPQGGVEMELVQAMAVARWRLRRLCTIETSLLNNEMLRPIRPFDQRITNAGNPEGHLAGAFRNLADTGQSLMLVIRYEGALNNSHDRAFRQLHQLQSARHRPQPNEPKSDSNRAPAPAPANPRIVSPIPIPAVLDPETIAPAGIDTDSGGFS
jgi:hypothetical protein